MTPYIYISHGANGDWFIVEPRDTPMDEVWSLLNAGRNVYALQAELPPRPFWNHAGKFTELEEKTT